MWEKQFLLFPQCFVPLWRTFCLFYPIWIYRLQSFSVCKSLKFIVWERVKTQEGTFLTTVSKSQMWFMVSYNVFVILTFKIFLNSAWLKIVCAHRQSVWVMNFLTVFENWWIHSLHRPAFCHDFGRPRKEELGYTSEEQLRVTAICLGWYAKLFLWCPFWSKYPSDDTDNTLKNRSSACQNWLLKCIMHTCHNSANSITTHNFITRSMAKRVLLSLHSPELRWFCTNISPHHSG